MNKFCLVIFFFCLANTLSGDPWGKDANLANYLVAAKQKQHPTPIVGPIAERLIKFHQDVISPADGPRSHFFPSSSQYTLEAMQQHGFIEGFLLGCDRLMRENSDPWCYREIRDPSNNLIRYDPVPNRG